jgi:hypothetical protein
MFRVQHLGLPERVPEDHPADHSGERAEHVTSALGRGQATGPAPQVNTWFASTVHHIPKSNFQIRSKKANCLS